jgi:hypothetical protein
VGDRVGESQAGNNLGAVLEKNGNLPAAARALVHGLAAIQRVERDLGAHDDRRVSLFEQQQRTYMVLQGVLLGLEQPGWALGVAAQAKGRALLYHLTSCSPGHSNEDHASMIAPDVAYEAVCEAWWRKVQQDAQVEGDAGAERIVGYSFLFDDRLAIWVLKGTGELLGSTTVSTRVGEEEEEEEEGEKTSSSGKKQTEVRQKGLVVGQKGQKEGGKRGAGEEEEEEESSEAVGGVRTLGENIAAMLKTMGVRGRDAMIRQAERESAEDAVQEDGSLRQGTVAEAVKAQGRLDAIKRDQEVLGASYQHLLAPVEAHLEGATEVLIIPHKKLFEVPWAAFFDSQTGQYLIQRFVLRVAPSLRVARTAADALLPSRTLAQSGIRAVARLALALKSTGIARRHAHVTRTCDGAGVSGRSGRAGRAGARRHCLCKVKVKWLKNQYDVEIRWARGTFHDAGALFGRSNV